ncbi:DUF3131 domain-containing protein [Actibacterium mucosum]|uniref:DUF3131 domain-containing protein n=1 Tax=Actibacterium mucosum TaxID=1087332 RepID=UPI00137836EF|nr:DUF3131 domain-containing protein [Actibacterium mucosum]
MALDAAGRQWGYARALAEAPDSNGAIDIAAQRALTHEEVHAARIAWAYFQSNTQPETGWVDSVAGFPGATMWDQGSYLFALVSAWKLDLISANEFANRATAILDAFDRMPLFDNQLPNKAYHTQTLQMVDYDNTVVEGGIGWSALDVARILLALRVLEARAPEFGDRVRRITAVWDLHAMTQKGELWGKASGDGEARYLQEGRLGYEQYGARAAALWGQDVTEAISARRALQWRDIGDVAVAIDTRDHRTFRAITPILSEPYILQGIELGLNSESAALAAQVYRAQVARYEDTGHWTMVSEDHIDQAPHFLYNSVYGNGREWAVLTEDGVHHPDLRTVSVKATFGWNALYGTEYTAKLLSELMPLGNVEKGWPAGRYEHDGRVNEVYTLNTNAVVLEALHFKAHGPLLAR